LDDTEFKKDSNVHLASTNGKNLPKNGKNFNKDWIRDPFLAQKKSANLDHKEERRV
jgi:hypothetical protein